MIKEILRRLKENNQLRTCWMITSKKKIEDKDLIDLFIVTTKKGGERREGGGGGVGRNKEEEEDKVVLFKVFVAEVLEMSGDKFLPPSVLYALYREKVFSDEEIDEIVEEGLKRKVYSCYQMEEKKDRNFKVVDFRKMGGKYYLVYEDWDKPKGFLKKEL